MLNTQKVLPPDWQAMGEAAKLFTRSLMMGLDSAVRKAEFDEPSAEDIENMPYHEAVEYLRKRDVIKKVDYDSLSDKMRFRAFTASRIADGDLLKKLNAEMIASVNDGKGLSDFLSLTKTDILDKIGMGAGSGWYYETVYRTNVQTAYNVGRAMGFAEDKPLALELVIIDDSRTSDICRQYAGKRFILPYDHPFWQTHWPPFHFNCRTTIRAIYDESELPENWSNPKDIEDANNGFGVYPLSNDSWWEELSSQVARAKEYGVQGEILGAKSAIFNKRENVINSVSDGKITQGEPMTFEEADGGNVNPFFSLGGGYLENCQTAVVAFEARLRGFNVRAKAYDENNIVFKRLAKNPLRAFIDPKTRHHPNWIENNSVKNWKDEFRFVKSTVKENERYVLQYHWAETGGGHIISVFKNKKGILTFYDPQNGEIYTNKDVFELLQDMLYTDSVKTPKILRIDNLQFDENIVKSILEVANE